jgi:hypothetical protein
LEESPGLDKAEEGEETDIEAGLEGIMVEVLGNAIGVVVSWTGKVE